MTRTIRVFAEANGRRQAGFRQFIRDRRPCGSIGNELHPGGGDGRTSSAGGVRSATLGAIRGQRNRASQADIPSQTGSPHIRGKAQRPIRAVREELQPSRAPRRDLAAGMRLP